MRNCERGCFIFRARRSNVSYFSLGPVINIAFSQQSHVVSASKDASLRVWDIASGESIAYFQGHTKPVLCLVLTGNGKTVVSGSEDKTIRVWDLASRDCVTLKGHEGNGAYLYLFTKGYLTSFTI